MISLGMGFSTLISFFLHLLFFFFLLLCMDTKTCIGKIVHILEEYSVLNSEL